MAGVYAALRFAPPGADALDAQFPPVLQHRVIVHYQLEDDSGTWFVRELDSRWAASTNLGDFTIRITHLDTESAVVMLSRNANALSHRPIASPDTPTRRCGPDEGSMHVHVAPAGGCVHEDAGLCDGAVVGHAAAAAHCAERDARLCTAAEAARATAWSCPDQQGAGGSVGDLSVWTASRCAPGSFLIGRAASSSWTACIEADAIAARAMCCGGVVGGSSGGGELPARNPDTGDQAGGLDGQPSDLLAGAHRADAVGDTAHHVTSAPQRPLSNGSSRSGVPPAIPGGGAAAAGGRTDRHEQQSQVPTALGVATVVLVIVLLGARHWRSQRWSSGGLESTLKEEVCNVVIALHLFWRVSGVGGGREIHNARFAFVCRLR